MRKLKLTVELSYDIDIWHNDDPEGSEWFYHCILMQQIANSGELILHSNEVGDTVGEIKVLSIDEISGNDRGED